MHQTATIQSAAGKRRSTYFTAAIHSDGDSRKNCAMARCIGGIQMTGATTTPAISRHRSGTARTSCSTIPTSFSGEGTTSQARRASKCPGASKAAAAPVPDVDPPHRGSFSRTSGEASKPAKTFGRRDADASPRSRFAASWTPPGPIRGGGAAPRQGVAGVRWCPGGAQTTARREWDDEDRTRGIDRARARGDARRLRLARAPADGPPRARLPTRGRHADHAEPDRRDRGQRRRASRRPQVGRALEETPYVYGGRPPAPGLDQGGPAAASG